MSYLDRAYNEQINRTIKAYKKYINTPGYRSKRKFRQEFDDLIHMALQQGYAGGRMETKLDDQYNQKIIKIYLDMHK